MPSTVDLIQRGSEGIRTFAQRHTGYDELYQSLVEGIEYLKSIGLPPNPTSRLERYRQIIGAQSEAIKNGVVGMPRFQGVKLALITREVDELSSFFRAAPRDPDHELRERLRRLAEGGIVGEEETGSPSREAQFELVLYTKSKRAGFVPTMGRPDITVAVGGHRLAIEAKRPSNGARLEDALRQAASVLASHNGPKLVAVQIDQVVRPKWGWLEVNQDWELMAQTHQILQEFIEKAGHLGIKRCVPKGVTAIAYFLASPGWIHARGVPTVSDGMFYHRFVEKDSPDYATVQQWALASARKA